MDSNAATDDRIGQLERLGQLRAQGLLTEEEFATQKARLLSPGPEDTDGRPTSATTAEPGYDNASENLALAGYIFALVFPIVGLIIGIMLLGRDRSKAGWSIIAISTTLICIGIAVAAITLGGNDGNSDGGLSDAIYGQ